MISSGKGVRCPSDGRKPKRVAILLCVGSRDRQIGREWCSKICCTVSANMAMEIREELPDCHVYIYYMDIRTFGLYETKYYWKSQEEFKVKYIKARIAEVTSDGEKLMVKGEDTLVKRPITIPFDMVVHAIGMDPNVDNPALAAIFGVELERHGYMRPRQRLRQHGRDVAPGRVRRRRGHGPGDDRRLDRAGQSAALAALGMPAAACARAPERRRRCSDARKRRACRSVADRPQLDLSGPRLRRAIESLVAGAETHGGIERYMDALKLKSAVFREALAADNGRRRDASTSRRSGRCARSCPRCAAASCPGSRSRPIRRCAPRSSTCSSRRRDTSGTDERIARFCAVSRRTTAIAGCATSPPSCCTTSTRSATR